MAGENDESKGRDLSNLSHKRGITKRDILARGVRPLERKMGHNLWPNIPHLHTLRKVPVSLWSNQSIWM